MKLHLSALAVVSTLSCVPTFARDTVLHVPLADLLAMSEAQGRLDPAAKFYLADQSTPKGIKRFATDVSNLKNHRRGIARHLHVQVAE